MSVLYRRYKLLSDFNSVIGFLEDCYNTETLNGYLLPQFFEYAHTHPAFKHSLAHRFGLWEEDGRIVGLSCYEMEPGECFLSARKGYEKLLPQMLDNAERELSSLSDSGHFLNVWITDREHEKKALLTERGYNKVHSEPITIFDYDNPFPDTVLPPGFVLTTLEDENDLEKIHRCLWKGFDNGDNPDDDVDCRLLMQSGPRFRPDLTTIIKSPDGQYACYAGMWLDERNSYAYLEPLATIPEYRRLGLAAAALVSSMKKAKQLGARYCFGGVMQFYKTLGFTVVMNRELWKKTWRDNTDIQGI